MARIIAVHSFRRGAGKSHLTANLAILLAAAGQRVGVIDASLPAPAIHLLFGLPEEEMTHSLNDYLWGRCEIAEAADDVTPRLGTSGPGRVYLIPASTQAHAITRVLRGDYDVRLLYEGLLTLNDDLHLDTLLIDSYPGLSEDTLSMIAVADTLVVVLRPDQQDYQGTAVTVEVARRLGVPRLLLVVNKVPPVFDPVAVGREVAQSYGCPVAAVLPHADEMLLLASAALFVLRYPDHPLTAALRDLAEMLVA